MDHTISVLTCLLFLVAGCGESGGLNSDLRELVDAEHAFAKASSSRGVRSAFLTYLADDAIIFRPEPVNGRQWYLDQPETSALLTWEPVVADVSRAGDLGYTTGPWQFSTENGETEREIFGHYISVWRKGSGGKWRVAIDVGTPHPKPTGSPRPLRVPEHRGGRTPGNETPEKHKADLLRTDREFSEQSVNLGLATAYGAYAVDDLLFYRSDEFPLGDLGAVRTFLGAKAAGIDSKPIGGEVSASGDLGYTYGTGEMASREKGEAVTGRVYFRIWRRMGGGDWKIVVDVMLPLPDESGDERN